MYRRDNQGCKEEITRDGKNIQLGWYKDITKNENERLWGLKVEITGDGKNI